MSFLFLLLILFTVACFEGIRHGDPRAFFRQSISAAEDEQRGKIASIAGLAYCAVMMIWLCIAYAGCKYPQETLILHRQHLSAHSRNADQPGFTAPANTDLLIKRN